MGRETDAERLARSFINDRKTLWKGRRGRFVWHVYRPSAPTRFGVHWYGPPVKRVSFSLRWVMGWVWW